MPHELTELKIRTVTKPDGSTRPSTSPPTSVSSAPASPGSRRRSSRRSSAARRARRLAAGARRPDGELADRPVLRGLTATRREHRQAHPRALRRHLRRPRRGPGTCSTASATRHRRLRRGPRSGAGWRTPSGPTASRCSPGRRSPGSIARATASSAPASPPVTARVDVRAHGFVDASGDAALCWAAGLPCRLPDREIYGSQQLVVENLTSRSRPTPRTSPPGSARRPPSTACAATTGSRSSSPAGAPPC